MIHHGDLFDVLPTLAEASVDACVTDPPYGIGFMGKKWDSFKPGEEAKRIVPNRAIESDNPNLKGRTRGPASSPSAVEYDYTVKGLREFQAWSENWAREVYRVLKPGAYVVVCGAPRSYHRMACGVEDAGFDVRDCLQWIFGQGFPKSLNLGDGRGTALKPSYEPIILARKPCEGSTTATVAKHGTGALNIDACRIQGDKESGSGQPFRDRTMAGGAGSGRPREEFNTDVGRWPANVLLDEDAAAMLDDQSGHSQSPPVGSMGGGSSRHAIYGDFAGHANENGYGDSGGASRFFYVAKPSREERDLGCHEMEARQRDDGRKDGNPGGDNPRNRGLQRRGNHHPTVKPIDLMRWLVRLVTPIDGTVLDPFTGSGTTGCACAFEGRKFIGIERESDYIQIAERRIAACLPLFGVTA